ncbi:MULTISPECIES: class I adenylate-forming enzyme family protein [Gordonia]|uniref:AMP-forming Acyl-CoA synthetases / AMP-acid ligases II n=1 Tax=Gordonia terrae C-6 TaxID=1316928 RepID=R7Y5N6_9ACTN|nr:MULTISPECIES: AMP-binding protein [Gordonia]EON31300.1 AMP-forming Acyl-CoA synthetases / AMP-acid ligases II [Gordonia terrae C-6]
MTATIGKALDWWARTKGDTTAVVFSGAELSYRALRDWSSRIARLLVETKGVAPGDRVGLLGPNSLEWPAAALGVLKSGGVLVPLNSRYRPAELRKIVDDAGIGVVIVAPGFEQLAEDTSAVGAPFSVVPFAEFDAMRTGGADDFRVDLEPDEPTTVLFTSGSTGLSKGVILTNRTLMSIVLENTLTEEGFRPGTTTLLVLPLAFTPGLVYGLLITTVLGGTLIVEPELNPSNAVTLLEKHSVQAIFGVPLIFEAISRAPEFADADLSSVKTAIVGGAAVPGQLLKRWSDKGVLLRQIYGMTEAGGVATATVREEALEFPDRCGTGSIFTEVKVFNSAGEPAAPGEEGELVVRGPGVTPGYWNDPETTAEAIRDGWLHSGDLGVADEDGRVQFVDRLKDLIISGGINISPVELEIAIGAIDGVEEVAVIAAHDDRFGETPAAIVTVSEDMEATTIVEHCKQVLADFKVPRYVVIRQDPLPRLPSGKIAKTVIRDEYKDVDTRFDRVR